MAILGHLSDRTNKNAGFSIYLLVDGVFSGRIEYEACDSREKYRNHRCNS